MSRLLPMLLLLAACGIPREKDPGVASVFPHPADFGERHGPDALTATAACQQCHALDEDRGAAKACRSCHTYPHEAGWVAGNVHGTVWRMDATTCADCHGADGTLAAGNVAHATCVACHASYPHPAGWEEGSGHGTGVLARGGDTACESCHGTDGAQISEATCTSCHAAYPHAAGWSEGSAHGAAYLADATTCGSCHTTASDSRRVACDTCHDAYPHPDGWATPAGHVPVVQSRGDAGCLSCHGDADAVGPSLPVGCAPTCHAEAR